LYNSLTFPGSANSSQRNSFSSGSGGSVKPLSSPSTQQAPILQNNMIIFGHDVDSVDVATRVAMVSKLCAVCYVNIISGFMFLSSIFAKYKMRTFSSMKKFHEHFVWLRIHKLQPQLRFIHTQ
jgi:hypothetical protein